MIVPAKPSEKRQNGPAPAAMASSPAAPNAGVAGFMKKYRTFVRRHRALLSAIEQGAAGMTWFIEGENSEVYAEAASSVVGVMSTLNDHLVADESDEDDDVGDAHSSPGTRGEIDSAYGNESDGGAAPDGGTGDRRRGSGGRDAKRSTWRERLGALAECVPTPLALTLCSQVETLSEMIARRAGGVDGAADAVVVMEAVKAALKTRVWLAQRGGSKLLVEDGMASEQLGDESESEYDTDVDSDDDAGFSLETLLKGKQSRDESSDDSDSNSDDDSSSDEDDDESTGSVSSSHGSISSHGSTSSFDAARATINQNALSMLKSHRVNFERYPPGMKRATLGMNALYQCRLRAQAEYWETRKHRLLETAEADEALLAENSSENEKDENDTNDEDETDDINEGAGEAGDDADESRIEGDPTDRVAADRRRRRRMKEMAKHRQFQRMHGLPPVPPPPHPFRIEDQLMRDRVDLNLRLVGELCHITRPLAYALARRRWGCKSWRALMVSATFDAASFSCLNGASGGIKRREPNFSSGEKAEMARRRAFLTYYLLRSPVFDTLTLPTARLVGRGVGWVPLLGSLYGKAVDIAEDVNDHFAYTY